MAGRAKKSPNPAYVDERSVDERSLDEALADSFPASDPVAVTLPQRSMRADKHKIAAHVAPKSARHGARKAAAPSHR